MAGFLIKEANVQGGYGFNYLHEEALLNTYEELT